jgi:hypothetical protein
MRRFIIPAVCLVATLAFASAASATVTQTFERVWHNTTTDHGVNICGNLATFTTDASWHVHGVDRDNGTFFYNYEQNYTYTVDFDDPALGTWTARATESIAHLYTGAQEIFHDNLVDMEGPVQIIVHEQLHWDASGNLTVDQEINRVVGCPS